MKNGSSETIRKTTHLQISSLCQTKAFYSSLSFHFENPQAILPQHKTKIDPAFLEWLIGFTEGGGSFLVSPAPPKEPSTRLYFVIVQEEVQILHHIRTTLGFGRVSQYGGYHRFIVADLKSIDRLIHIFNGNILLNKVNARFAQWVDARNKIDSPKQDKNNVIVLKPRLFTRLKDSGLDQTSYLLSSAWFSGFIDAEGCFNIGKAWTKTSPGFSVKLRFIVDQRDERDVFEEVQRQFQGGFIYIKTGPDDQLMLRYECDGAKDIATLQNYLSKYPLKSRKRFSCKRFFF